MLTKPALQRAIEHVVTMGARPVAELVDAAGGDAALQDCVPRWRDLDPRPVRAAGGDRFPPCVQPVATEGEDTP